MPIRPELRKLYPENWSEITDRIRFKRAGGSCERCGAQHGRPHPETGKVEYLSTAHLDHDPTNNAEENLAALCRICHNRNDSKNRAANRKHNAYRRRRPAAASTAGTAKTRNSKRRNSHCGSRQDDCAAPCSH